MKYSIITINYNNCDGLRRTIESVVNQTYTDYEYIVIDGGSTDGSVDVIKEYTDKIDYWVSEPDKGIYNAMNKGIIQAHGDYLNFMNSGDCFYDESILQSLMQINNVDIIFGQAKIINSDIVYKYKTTMTLFDLCTHGFNHQATFYKSTLFGDNEYDENLSISGDWKFTIQCVVFKNCSYQYLEKIFVLYDGTGISTKQYEQRKNEQYKILQELLPTKIADDYIMFSQIKSPLLEYIPYISNTYTLHKFVMYIVKKTIKIHKLIKRLK